MPVIPCRMKTGMIARSNDQPHVSERPGPSVRRKEGSTNRRGTLAEERSDGVRATTTEGRRVPRGIPRWAWQRGTGPKKRIFLGPRRRSEATTEGGDGRRGEKFFS